eukprot:TRINITY_DN2600_c0_g1_i1.p1 TRINITY_DN2600_c0_g1~~TRINITY_DN2600_c0_g1_i1.p1  ORF type:complete len:424 (+),score=67.79 TRINITY_DN2600_c0_g1_i1:174-1445(+)
MVGASLACSVGSSKSLSDIKIGVIDSVAPTRTQITHDTTPSPRVVALNTKSVAFLRQIGVWEKLIESRLGKFVNMSVWDNSGAGNISFSAKDLGTSELGYIVANDDIQLSLLQRMDQLDNVTLLSPVKIESIDFPSKSLNSTTTSNTFTQKQLTDSLITVNTKEYGKLKTKLLIGADGKHSLVRNAAGISATGYEYNQLGVVSVVRHDKPNDTSLQRFLSDGQVIAMLPMYDNYSTIVWSTTPFLASKLINVEDKAFVSMVSSAFGSLNNNEKIPRILNTVGKRGAFPLSLMHASEYVKWRLALIGDAAHVIHPLAGQGVNLGFQDVISLRKFIEEGYLAGLDIGDMNILLQYQHERYWQNVAMLAGVDALKTIFNTSVPIVSLARNLGLNLVNGIFPIKKFFHTIASGDLGDLVAINYSPQS